MPYDRIGELFDQGGADRLAAGNGAEVVFLIQLKGNAAGGKVDMKRNGITLYIGSDLVNLAGDNDGKRFHAANIGIPRGFCGKKRRPGNPGLPAVNA